MLNVKCYQLATMTNSGDIVPFGPLMTLREAQDAQSRMKATGHEVMIRNLLSN